MQEQPLCPTTEEYILPIIHGNDRVEWFVQLSDEIQWEVEDRDTGAVRARVTMKAGDVAAMPADIRHRGFWPKRSMLFVWENASPELPALYAAGKMPPAARAVLDPTRQDLVLRSRYGLGLMAIRDSEPGSEALGIDVSAGPSSRSSAGVAFGTGVTGALIYLNLLRISPDAAFSINWTAYPIFIVVIGGLGTLEGPLVGTALFFLVRESLSDHGAWYMILLGALAVGVMLAYPHGLRGCDVPLGMRGSSRFSAACASSWRSGGSARYRVPSR